MPLFAFGSNGSGQLGLGHTEDVSIPTRCVFDDEIPPAASQTENSKIVRIAAGGNHTLVLFENGAVYAAGCNVDGRCGLHHTEVEGENEGESEVLRFRRVVVTVDGHGDWQRRTYDTFNNVSATWEGTFLVASSSQSETNNNTDKVFALGPGTKGELGLGTTITTTTPMQIPHFPPPGTRIISIASGMGHTAAVLSNGEVYGWGGARKGQLGEGAAKEQKVVWSPTRVEGVSFKATDVACGREFTVVTGDRGKGEFVVLGSENDKWGVVSGQPVLPAYASISAGWHGVYVYHDPHSTSGTSSSSITAWGRNDRGQLPPADLPTVQKLAVGSEHALVLLDEWTVAAFGWGEHGNCGSETDAQGNVNGRYNKIQISSEGGEGRRIVGIGAGCATSWIITE